MARYANNPNVLYAEPNFIRRIPTITSHTPGSEAIPGEFYFDEQYALHNTGQFFYCLFEGFCLYVATPDADIDAPEAWEISKGSRQIKVGIIDSGLDYTHPDLAANYLGGYNFIDGNTDPMDVHGHGTHVAGTIGAALGNLTGSPGAAEGVVGVAPEVSLLSYKVCRLDGTCDDFAIQNAIAQAIVDGAKVINMSLGETAFSQSLNQAVQDAWAENVVIVAGAGNNGTTVSFYPAAFDNVVSVAAFDEDHRRASFSNYGWPKISAPGNVIMSTYPMAACAGSVPVPGDTGCYNWLSGTSMATPHVAGAAALVWSRSDVTSNSQVVDILLNSADPQGAATTPLDSWTVHGGLNIHNALSHGVVLNQPPVANAGVDQTLTDNDGNGFETVTLEGNASSDADGILLSYQWSEGSTGIAGGATPAVPLGVGDHTLTLTVTDDDGATASDTVLITILAAAPTADTVAVLKAAYQAARRQLTIEATSSSAPDATLTAYDNSNPGSPAALGALAYNARKAKYTGTFGVPSAPASVLVISSGGGSATGVVTGKK
ncbi:MAG TPA: S8 family serine peptidase [Vicinamibacterales bacterium]|nr:S8 family serine peptidase [Vicinamibacterales bacterium]